MKGRNRKFNFIYLSINGRNFGGWLVGTMSYRFHFYYLSLSHKYSINQASGNPNLFWLNEVSLKIKRNEHNEKKKKIGIIIIPFLEGSLKKAH